MTLHVAGALHSRHSSDAVFPDAFRPWRAQIMRDGVRPVIAIAGARGKSTVTHLLERMFDEAGLVCATRTDAGVMIRGERQSDERAWDRVFSGLNDNVFDIAIDELTWREIAELNADVSQFAVTAITNVCANRDECLIQDESRLAVASLPNLIGSTANSGALVLNSEDLAVIGQDLDHGPTTIFVGQDRDNPVLQFHLECGGIGAWRSGPDETDRLNCGALGSSSSFGDLADLEFTLRGAAAFQITNALTAIAIAASCGVPHYAIRRALRTYVSRRDQPVAVFHVSESRGVHIVIDRPNPSWYLRQVVRAVRDANAPRVITLVGELDSVPASDLSEIGRLLGRLSNVLIVHSSAVEENRVKLLRHGVAQNSMPPVIVHTQTEQRAMALALDRARRDDLIFVLADNPSVIHREILVERMDSTHHAPDILTAAAL
jgi:cyanophycin synthetase